MDSGEPVESSPHRVPEAAGADDPKNAVREAAAELQSSVEELFATNSQCM
jgi:hypothetical protein